VERSGDGDVSYGEAADAVIAALRLELRTLRAKYDQLRADLAARDFERPPHY
jgi:uncharacterized coiled-coil protein SlyX